MSEYSTYHTHGRYVPPGSTKRSPYEEVREAGAAAWARLCLGSGSERLLGKPKELRRGDMK